MFSEASVLKAKTAIAVITINICNMSALLKKDFVLMFSYCEPVKRWNAR